VYDVNVGPIKEALIKNVTPATLQWLLDVIVDSRCDITQNNTSLTVAHIPLNIFDFSSFVPLFETIRDILAI